MSASRILLITFLLFKPAFVFCQQTSASRDLFNQGRSTLGTSPDKALVYFEKALGEAKKENDWTSWLTYLNEIAPRFYYTRGENRDKVFGWIKDAFEKQNVNHADSTAASLLYWTGNYWWTYNDSDKSIEYYNKAKAMFTKLFGEMNVAVAECYHGLANNYKYKKLDLIEAEKYYERALQIRERINFQNKAILYHNYYGLSSTNRSQRDFEKAIAYGLKTLEMAEELNNPGLLQHTYGMVANIYRDINAFQQARNYYQKAIEIHKSTNNSDEILASQYVNLGEMLKNNALYEEALTYFAKASTIFSHKDIQDKLMYLYGLSQTAEILMLQKDLSGATKVYRDLLKKLIELNVSEENQIAEVYLGYGRLLVKKNNPDSALFYHQKALMAAARPFKSLSYEHNPTEEMIGTNYYRVHEILNSKASVLNTKFIQTKNTAYLKQSLACLSLSEKLLTLRRNNFDTEDAKWRMGESDYNIYEEILSSLYALIQLERNDSLFRQASQFLAKSKARMLSEALADAEIKGKLNHNDTLFKNQDRIKKQMFSVQDQLNKEKNNSSADASRITALQEEVVTLDREMQHLKSAIEEKYPGYFIVKYDHIIPSLTALQQRCKVQKQTIIEFFWGNKSVYGFAINNDTVVFKRLGSTDTLYHLIHNVLKYVYISGGSLSRETFSDFAESAYLLHEKFILPFKTLTEKNSRLHIIPDGPVSQLPFEILLRERANINTINFRILKYLIYNHAISYSYSSTVTMRSVPGKISKPSLLAMSFSNDVFPNPSNELTRQTPSLTDIRGTNLELDFLSKKFSLGKFLKSEEATETAFKAFAPQHDLLHLAIHGKGDPKENYSSSLFFKADKDSLEDSELHAYEVYALKLKAQLAVLTACESGLGKTYKGEGMISMASALTYSGCRNIIMSLWKVNDETSVDVMNHFYDKLSNGENIDIALREAKLAYLSSADELTSDPRFWAHFVAYGNMESVFEKEKSRTVVITFIAFAILLLVFLFRRFRVAK